MTLFVSLGFMAVPCLSIADTQVSIDSRVKYLAYNPNEVFNVVVAFGYQSYIEFADGETVQNMAIGSNALWSVESIGNKLFVTPLSKSSHTNMIILTNKNRSYAFDLNSASKTGKLNEDVSFERDMSYIVRFFYPDEDAENADIGTTLRIKSRHMESKEAHTVQEIIHPNKSEDSYKYVADDYSNELVPLEIFDDGALTYLKFKKVISGVRGAIPQIFSVKKDDEKSSLKMLSFEEYIVVSGVHKKLLLKFRDKRVEIVNSTF